MIFYNALGKIKIRTLLAVLAAVLALTGRPVGAEEAPAAAEPAKAAPSPAAPAPSAAAEYIGAETCISCHANRENFKENIHAKAFPAEKGIEFSKSCETCHGPGSLHAAAAGDKTNPGYATIRNPAQLKGSEVSATCMQCHSGGQRNHWDGSSHEVKGVACTACHSVHDSAVNGGKAPLLAKVSQVEVCAQCHADKKAQIHKSAHMPLLEGKMGCTNCHNPHGSVTPKLLVKNSVPETCYQCHQDKRGPFLWEHPPVRESCLSCHDPHGNHNDKMLVIKSPILCQRCHAGTRHPSTFYNVAGSNNSSNRVFNRACLNCHANIHGSNHPSGKFLLR